MNAITRKEAAALNAPVVSFTLNGREVSGRADETLIEIAGREGVEIPRLCYKPGLEEVGKGRQRSFLPTEDLTQRLSRRARTRGKRARRASDS